MSEPVPGGPIKDFTTVIPFWQPRVAPVEFENATDEQLEAMTRKKSPWAPVEGEKAQIGDLLTANVVVLTKGQKEAEPKPAQLVIGDGSAIPEIEERLMEMEIGEKKETSVRYHDDFPDETMCWKSR